MNQSNNFADQHEPIVSYLNGELTEAEAAEFERRMNEGDALRAEVERWNNVIKAANVKM